MAVNSREEILTVIQSNQPVLQQYGVKSLALFGSAARNKIARSSDIDFLVQFERPTWANYIGLKFYLQDLLGREVDLATPEALKPAIRPAVEEDLLYVIV